MSKVQRLLDAAILAEEAGRFSKALTLYKKASTLDKNDPAVQVRWASLLYDRGRLKEAISVARNVARRWPKVSQAHLIVGRSYAELGYLRRAERAFRQSLVAKPEPYTWVLLSDVLSRLDRVAESEKCLRRALDVDPDYEEAHYNLGCIYRLRGKYALAVRHLRRAIQIDPKYSLAYSELGQVLLRRKETVNEAVRFLRSAVAYDPSDGWTTTYLANGYWRLRKWKAADRQYRRLIEIWPNDSLSYWCYGDFLAYRGKDRSVAEAYLRKAIEMDPNSELTSYYLGKHLVSWGKKKEGMKLLTKSARLGYQLAQAQLEAIEVELRG